MKETALIRGAMKESRLIRVANKESPPDKGDLGGFLNPHATISMSTRFAVPPRAWMRAAALKTGSFPAPQRGVWGASPPQTPPASPQTPRRWLSFALLLVALGFIPAQQAAAQVPTLSGSNPVVIPADGETLVLTYSQDLNMLEIPSPNYYTLTLTGGGGQAPAITTVVIGSRTVTLMLSKPATAGQMFTLAYNPIFTRRTMDLSGNIHVEMTTLPGALESTTSVDALEFTNQSVTNNSTVSTEAMVDISRRTQAVQEVIVAAISGGVSDRTAVPMSALNGITTLDFTGRTVPSLWVGDFANLTGLETLNLRNIGLTNLPVGIFDDLRSLRTLDLRDNALTIIYPSTLVGLPELRGLHLSGNNFRPGSDRGGGLPRGVFDDLIDNGMLDTVPIGTAFAANSFEYDANMTAAHFVCRTGASQITDIFDRTNAIFGTSYTSTADNCFRITTARFDCFVQPLVDGACGMRPLRDHRDLYDLMLTEATTFANIPFTPPFKRITAAYSANVDGNVVRSITVTPTPQNNEANILINNDMSVAPGRASGPIPLNVGVNTIRVQVTSPDTTRSRTYTLTVNRSEPSAVDLTLNSATILADGDELELVYQETLDGGFVPIPSRYTLTLTGGGGQTPAVKTVRVSGSTVRLMLSKPAFMGQVFTLAYDPMERRMGSQFMPPWPYALRDTAGNLEQMFTGQAVTNNSTVQSVNICRRTPLVRMAIINALPGNPDCDSIPRADLEGLTSLNLSDVGLSVLRAGDFANLRGLTSLSLDTNDLTALPIGIFDGLSNLVTLNLRRNSLIELLPTVLNGLDALQGLDLRSNNFNTTASENGRGLGLPRGVFDDVADTLGNPVRTASNNALVYDSDAGAAHFLCNQGTGANASVTSAFGGTVNPDTNLGNPAGADPRCFLVTSRQYDASRGSTPDASNIPHLTDLILYDYTETSDTISLTPPFDIDRRLPYTAQVGFDVERIKLAPIWRGSRV